MTPVLVISDPQILQDVLVRNFNYFSQREHSYHRIQKQGVTAVSGKRWKDQGAIIAPTFTSRKMKAMQHLIKQSIKNLTDSMDSKMVAGSADFDNKELYGDLTLDVISRCAFAAEANVHPEGGPNIILENMKEFLNISQFWLLLLSVLPVCETKIGTFNHQT